MSDFPEYKMQQLEYWPVSDLIEYARNPRKNDHAVDKVAAAIREFGFRVPILAKSDKTVVDGHLRLKAAKKLGLETVPVMLCDDMSDAQIKAFRISVNRVAEFAEWDDELLRVEFAELEELGFDLELTGFDADQIDDVSIDIEDVQIPDTVGRANEHGRLEAYLDQDIKMIRLTYQAEEYDSVYDAISGYMAEHDIKDMSSAVAAKFLDKMS